MDLESFHEALRRWLPPGYSLPKVEYKISYPRVGLKKYSIDAVDDLLDQMQAMGPVLAHNMQFTSGLNNPVPCSSVDQNFFFYKYQGIKFTEPLPKLKPEEVGNINPPDIKYIVRFDAAGRLQKKLARPDVHGYTDPFKIVINRRYTRKKKT